MKNLRSLILSLAHALKKKHGISFGDAQRQAWKVYRLKKATQTGKANFTFLKTDGKTVRPAKGTLIVEGYEFKRKTDTPQKTSTAIKYYDLEKNAWRSFSAINLI